MNTGTIKPQDLPKYVPGELALDSAKMGMTDFRLRVFRYAASDVWIPPLEDFLVVIYREGSTSMNRRVTGAWKQDHVGQGVVTLLTRAEASSWRWGDDVEVCHFYISPALMFATATEVFDREAERMELHDLLRAEDPTLIAIADQMTREVAADSPGGRLYCDALAMQANIHILRKYASVDFKLPSSHGRFRAAHARLLEDYIDANLTHNITLRELAGILNITSFQLARQFKAHFGMQPHAYVAKRKIERACRHLREDRLPLKEIAVLTGFSDQSHLNRIFRRHLDTTPAKYRKDALI